MYMKMLRMFSICITSYVYFYLLGRIVNMTSKTHPKAGQSVCFLAKNKKAREYGVLVRDVRPIDTFGTCVMHGANNVGVAGTLQSFPAKDLHVAWLRLNNLDSSSADKKAMPRNELRTLYNNTVGNQQQLLQKIEDCEDDYLTRLAEGIQAKMTAQGKKRKESKGPRKKSKVGQKGNKAHPQPAIPIGTKVSGYFQNSQAYSDVMPGTVQKLMKQWSKKHAKDSIRLREGWDVDGEMFPGEVIDIITGDANYGALYVCKFNTPNELMRTITEDEVHDIMVDDLEHASSDTDNDGLSSIDEEPPNVSLTLGTKLLRTVHDVGPTFATVTSMHEGVIQSIGIKLRLKRYRCHFPTHETSSNWYTDNETQTMANAFSTKMAPVATLADGRLKCKGALQRKTISEACAVVRRPKLAPVFASISGTPESQAEGRKNFKTEQTADNFSNKDDNKTSEEHNEGEQKEEEQTEKDVSKEGSGDKVPKASAYDDRKNDEEKKHNTKEMAAKKGPDNMSNKDDNSISNEQKEEDHTEKDISKEGSTSEDFTVEEQKEKEQTESEGSGAKVPKATADDEGKNDEGMGPDNMSNTDDNSTSKEQKEEEHTEKYISKEGSTSEDFMVEEQKEEEQTESGGSGDKVPKATADDEGQHDEGKERDENEKEVVIEDSGPDCTRGSYRRQDLAALDEYRRSIGTKPLRNGTFLPLNEHLAKLPLPTFYVDESKSEKRKKVAAHILAQLAETKAGVGAFTSVEETTTKKKKKKNKRKKVTDSATPPVEDPVGETVTNPTKKKKKRKKTNNVLPQTPETALSTDKGPKQKKKKKKKKRRHDGISPDVDAAQEDTFIQTEDDEGALTC